MDRKDQLIQNPAPGSHMVKFRGDTVEFVLNLPYARIGTAWIRTNIGRGRIIRKEIIQLVHTGETPLGRAWFDIPMQRVDERTFTVKLPLWEIGHFEAKCFFLPENEITPRASFRRYYSSEPSSSTPTNAGGGSEHSY